MDEDKKELIEPINATFDDVVSAVAPKPDRDCPSNLPGAQYHIKNMPQKEIDKLPFAKWRGKIDLGGDELDCYVLDDETRVISSGSTTKAIADVERGSLQDYIGQKSLNPFIDKEKVLQETIRFSIPGTQWVAIR